MECRKCGNKLVAEQLFCNKCGNINEMKDITKEIRTKESKLSIILFSISFIVYSIAMFVFGAGVDESESVNMLIMMLFFLPVSIPFILSIVFDIRASKAFKKFNRLGFEITSSRKRLHYINKIKYIFIFFMLFFPDISSGLRYEKLNSNAKNELDKLYDNNYEIVEDCRETEDYLGGSDEYIVLFKLKEENMYSLITQNVGSSTYENITDGLKKGENIKLDKYFDNNYYSVINAGETAGVIIDYSRYNLDDLETRIKMMENDLEDKYGYMDFKIYFVDGIDKNKLDYYEYFLVSNLSEAACIQEFDADIDSMDDFMDNIHSSW